MLINTLDIANSNHFFHFLPFATELAIAPLIYLYSVSLIIQENKFRPINVIHFLPFAFFQLWAIFVYVSVFNIDAFEDKTLIVQSYYYSVTKDIEDYLTVASIFSYLSFGFVKLTRYRQYIRDNIAESNYPTFTWLKNVFLLSTGLLVFLIVNMIISRLTNLQGNSILHWKIYFVYIACIIYYLGFKGYKLPRLNIKPSTQELPTKAARKLTPEKIKQVSTAFKNNVVDSKLYLDPNINALELSKIIGVSQSTLSYAINQFFGKSFRDYINELRIEEVKTRLLDQQHNQTSVLALALECGFNSEASFYRIFKNSTGMSPKAFSAQNSFKY